MNAETGLLEATLRREFSDIPAASNTRSGRKPGPKKLTDEWKNRGLRMIDPPGPSSDIYRIDNMLDPSNPALAFHLGRKPLAVVFDPAVYTLYAAKFIAYFEAFHIEYQTFVLHGGPSSENRKDWYNIGKLIERMLEAAISSRYAILSIGGGVTSDSCGFVASIFYRGLDFYCVPTTLTSVCDAAVSPKTALNLGDFKNPVGTVYPPAKVMYDLSLLGTVPRRELVAGLAEIIKIGIVRCEPIVRFLEADGRKLVDDGFSHSAWPTLVDLAILLFHKMKYEEPFPGNKPASLRSFGHRFSKSVETLCSLSLLHGEAVSTEMAIACCIAHSKNGLTLRERNRVFKLLASVGLPTSLRDIDWDYVWERCFKTDAKKGMPFYLPVPLAIGKGGFLNEFTRSDFMAAVESAKSGVLAEEFRMVPHTGGRNTQPASTLLRVPGLVRLW
jgi:3-dehydroquinate synthetase